MLGAATVLGEAATDPVIQAKYRTDAARFAERIGESQVGDENTPEGPFPCSTAVPSFLISLFLFLSASLYPSSTAATTSITI